MEWLLINQNIIGAIAVIMAVIFSHNKQLPVIILLYYFLFFLVSTFYEPSAAKIEIFHAKNVHLLYLIYAVIDFVIVLLCCNYAVINKNRFSLCYGIIVTFYLCLDMIQGLSFFTSHRYELLAIYIKLQSFAVPIDIAFAWLGSDNAISNRINPAIRGNVYRLLGLFVPSAKEDKRT